MAEEPSFPKEAAVGTTGGSETLDVAASVKETQKAVAERKQARGGGRSFITGAAVGVGSAALVAALLYARGNRRGSGEKS